MEAEAVYKAMLEARALLDSGADARQSAGAGHRCISLRVADELYAVDLAAVREVIVPPALVPVPGAGPEVLGVINLRGSVVTVVNSRAMLGLPGRPGGASARILVLDEGGDPVGALVDAVDDIIAVAPDEIEPVMAKSPRPPRVAVHGALTVGDHIAFLIGAEALVGSAAPAP